MESRKLLRDRVLTRGIMRETTKSITPRVGERVRTERSDQLTKILSYFSARRLCKCNHIVSRDEIIQDNARVVYLFANRFQQEDLHIGRMSTDYACFPRICLSKLSIFYPERTRTRMILSNF